MEDILELVAIIVLHAIAPLAWRAAWWKRVLLFAALVCLSYAATRLTIPILGWAHRAELLPMSIVPIIAAVAFLFSRGPEGRRTAIIVGSIVIVGLASLIYASVASHALVWSDGVANLRTFLKAQEAVRDGMNDPDSAKFRDLRIARNSTELVVCGEVNARNRMGGLVGFTRFFVKPNSVITDVFFDQDGTPESFDRYMTTCYGPGWRS